MANSKKPRKRYIPKLPGIPVLFRFGQEDEQKLQMVPHAELLKLRNGLADAGTWHTIVCRLNIGMTIAHQGEQSDEAKQAMAESLQAMRDVWARHEKTAKWGASGDELKAIGDGLVLTDDLQKASTRRELRDAMNHVFKVAAV